MNAEKLYKVCLRCGRKLKNLEARQRGFGKICFEKWKESQNHKKQLFTK